MKVSIKNVLDKNGIMIIDGSMSTALEAKGADLNNSLWTAKVLALQPELVKEVHIDYFNAGADCGITCSYQATIQGLMKNGFTENEAEDIVTRSVTVFKDARDLWWNSAGESAGRCYPVCLAGIGPYGAYLADGSEYTGNYDLTDEELRDFHKRRIELLWNAGADVLLFETQPSLKEVLVLAEIAEQMKADYMISFSCKDGKHINDGTLISDCAKLLSKNHPHLQMIGVNCTKPVYIEELVKELKANTSLPVGVYPNSGEEYNPLTKTWHGTGDNKSFEDYCYDYLKAGASAIGGCCTTVEKHIAQAVRAKTRFVKKICIK